MPRLSSESCHVGTILKLGVVEGSTWKDRDLRMHTILDTEERKETESGSVKMLRRRDVMNSTIRRLLTSKDELFQQPCRTF